MSNITHFGELLRVYVGVYGPLTIMGALMVACSLLYVIYIQYVSPLAGIPGPFWASLSRFWLAYHAKKGDMHIIMRKLHAKHGKLVRTAPDEVSVADLSAFKDIYGASSCRDGCPPLTASQVQDPNLGRVTGIVCF